MSSTKIDDAVTRAVCIVDELAILPELVDEIEAADRSPSAVRSEAAMTSGVRELIEHLRFHTDLMTNLMTRLERIAGTG